MINVFCQAKHRVSNGNAPSEYGLPLLYNSQVSILNLGISESRVIYNASHTTRRQTEKPNAQPQRAQNPHLVRSGLRNVTNASLAQLGACAQYGRSPYQPKETEQSSVFEKTTAEAHPLQGTQHVSTSGARLIARGHRPAEHEPGTGHGEHEAWALRP